jgi:hypothetical protein
MKIRDLQKADEAGQPLLLVSIFSHCIQKNLWAVRRQPPLTCLNFRTMTLRWMVSSGRTSSKSFKLLVQMLLLFLSRWQSRILVHLAYVISTSKCR